MPGWIDRLKVGDTVTRMLSTIPMQLKITKITDSRIICGEWEFSKRNGAEMDEYMGWNEEQTGSYLKMP